MAAVGIDLGTTFSLIGAMNSEGLPTLFPDSHDANLFRTPSVVHIGAMGCLVGSSVEDMLEDTPQLQVSRFFKLSLGKTEPVYRDFQNRDWSPEALSALVLIKLKKDAERFCLEDIQQAVITVPSQFGDQQRRATRKAAMLAGFKQITLKEEPMAAAVYFGQTQRDRTLLVYDFGGGTFDATILRSSVEGHSVLATDGRSDIGGKWIDDLLMQRISEAAMHSHGTDPRQNPMTNAQLRKISEQIKIKLCKPGCEQLRHSSLLGNRPFETIVRRRDFETLLQPMLEATFEVCENCLAAAGLSWSHLDAILLVGGSSLIPCVRNQLAARAGKTAEEILCRQPHQAVAFGAALLAAHESSTSAELPLCQQTISPYHLGLRVRNPSTGELTVSHIIQRNSPLPAHATKIYRTSRADQTRMVLEVVQTKGDPKSALSLGYFVFGPIDAPRQGYPIQVTFDYDVEGLVSIRANDAQSGKRIDHTMSVGNTSPNSPMLSPEECLLVASVNVNHV